MVQLIKSGHLLQTRKGSLLGQAVALPANIGLGRMYASPFHRDYIKKFDNI
jgi:hypothetical protein